MTSHASTPKPAPTMTATMMHGPASTSFHQPSVESLAPIGPDVPGNGAMCRRDGIHKPMTRCDVAAPSMNEPGREWVKRAG